MKDMEPDNRSSIERAAAEWVIRLEGTMPAEGHDPAFDRWRRQDPAHAAAFGKALATWNELAMLKTDPGPLLDDLGAVSSRRHAARPPAAYRARRSGWNLRAGALAFCLMAVGGLSLFWYGNPVTMLAADYRSAPGELKSVTLPDGSRVELASSSSIALKFDDGERRVALLEGSAYFIVAPMAGAEKRPFIVESDTGTARALGTEFSVERLSDAVEVAVAEHDVRVEHASAERPLSYVVLSAGQSVRYSAASGLDAVREQNVELATAWRRGRLVFNEVPLSEVVAELNRYRRGRIVITDTGLAGRKVSGLFRTDDLDNALDTITRELGLSSVSVPPLVTLIF